MHIIKDENGNPIPHGGHDHEHCHEQEHCHAAEEGHCHEHHHDHEHHHGGQAPQTKDQMIALLDYMAKHNAAHTAELDGMTAKLVEAGRADAADQVRKAVDEFQKGNMYLSLALSMIRE